MLFLYFSFLSNTLAQDPPVTAVPAGFGINEFQTIENLSSGALNFSLPIESSIVPVSISYATSGIRVNQRPGVVGLGWNLNAGGYIMRMKQGLADDHAQGFSGASMRGTSVGNYPLSSEFDNMVGSTGNNGSNPSVLWDTQPDVYSFQFPGGGGVFTMTSGRVPVILGGTLLKIDRTYNTSTNKYTDFTITDDQGNKYLFSTIETVKTKVDGIVAEEYTLKWHLTSITYYATGDIASFTYTDGPTYNELTFFRWRRTVNPGGTSQSDTDNVEQEYKPKLLTNISYSNTDVDFTYGTRTDITTLKKLDKVTYKINNSIVLEYDFGYLYLGETGAKRLMLSGIQKSNLDLQLYQFSYFGEDSGELTLPAYNSSKQDHWGFYNANTSSSLFTQLSANRSPSLSYARANTLKKIYTVTGGYQEFEYQLNEYRASGIDYAAGGLRIYKIYQKSGDGTNYTSKTYSYDIPGTTNSSGEIYAVPDVEFRYDDVEASKVYFENREYSLDPLTDIMGRHIAYEYVTVQDIDLSTIEHQFKTFSDEASLLGSGNVFLKEPQGFNRTTGYLVSHTTVNSTLYTGPFGNRNFKGVAAGLIERKTFKDASGTKLSEEVYGYLTRPSTTTVKGFNYLRHAYREPSNQDVDKYMISIYELGNGYLLNNSVQQITYDGVNSRNIETDIVYDVDYPLPTLQETFEYGNFNQDIRRKTQTTYYFRESGVLSQVETNNLRSLVKNSYEKLGYTTLSQTENLYGLFNGKVVVTGQKQYIKGQLTGQSVLTYNNDGLVAETQDFFSGQKNASLYDTYDRPIATVNNASLNQVAFTSFEQGDNGGWSYNTSFTGIVGLIGSRAYPLSSGGISKSLSVAGTYILSYWKGSTGYLTISGASSNTLVKSKTVNTGISTWTYEERELVLGSSGTLSLSGTAYLDHLSLYPKESRMSNMAYDRFFGLSAESDGTYSTVIYKYDDAGRRIGVLDENQDYLSSTIYEIEGFANISATSFSPTYTGASYEVYINSNVNWVASGYPSWVTVTRATNQGNDNLTIQVATNSTGASRSGSILISGPGMTNQYITINQGAGSSTTLLASPSTLYISSTNQGDIAVTSNIGWTASTSFGTAITLSTTGSCGYSSSVSGIGNATIKVCAEPSASGYITISISGSGITRIVNVYY